MENALTTTNEKGLKELWKRPGGTFAKITGFLALGGAAFAFCKYALPFLVAATGNLLLLAVELVALAAIIFIFTSKPFLRAVSLGWLQLMRKLYGLIVNIDPIAILQNGINEMKKKLGVVNENVTKLESVLVDMKRKLKEYESNFEDNVRKRESLQKRLGASGDSNETLKLNTNYRLIQNEITRGGTQISTQKERISTSEKYLDIMKKLQIAADFKVRDAQNELTFRKDEYEQAKAQQKAMSSITSIIKGSLTKSMEEELAMENVTDTINTSIAEINRLLDGSNDILMNFELNQDVNCTKADEIVKMFETNGFSIFEAKEEPTFSFSHKAITSGAQKPETVKVEVVNEVNQNNSGRYF